MAVMCFLQRSSGKSGCWKNRQNAKQAGKQQRSSGRTNNKTNSPIWHFCQSAHAGRRRRNVGAYGAYEWVTRTRRTPVVVNRPSSAYEHHYSHTSPPFRSLRARTLAAGDRHRCRNPRHGTTAAEWRARIGRGGAISRLVAPMGVSVAPRPSGNRRKRSVARVHEMRTSMTRRFYIGVDYCATFAVPPKNRDSQ